jgi:hypothetical protein
MDLLTKAGPIRLYYSQCFISIRHFTKRRKKDMKRSMKVFLQVFTGLALIAGVLSLGLQTAAAATNLALNKPVTFSSQQVGNEASHAVDGSTTTRWAAEPWPQWIQVDLGATNTIDTTEIMPYASRAYQYRVEVSLNGTSYTTVVDKTTNTVGGATLTDTFAPASARYVRLTITGASGYTGGWASIYELRVFNNAGGPTATNTSVGPTPTRTNTPVGPTPTNTPVVPTPTPGGTVDFGPNVHIFDTSMSASAIQSVITSVYNAQQNNQFGDRRDVLMFKPGTYNVDIGVGFYTEVLGLGAARPCRL